MAPYGSNQTAHMQLFETKREVFILRKGAIGSKHFMDEKEEDWINEMHREWKFNPLVRLRKSEIRV